MRVNDGEPGSELQIDFGRMGLVPDPAGGGRRLVHALIFTACYSRHCFVWLSHRQTTAAVIVGRRLFAFVTDLVRPVGTYLYGRRMYETRAPWETVPALAAQSELMADFANVWEAADKVVYPHDLGCGVDRQHPARVRLRPRVGP